MHVDDAITSRKSVRRFLSTPVPRATVRRHLPLAEHELLVCAVAPGREDPAAPENAFPTWREPVEAFTTFHGFA